MRNLLVVLLLAMCITASAQVSDSDRLWILVPVFRADSGTDNRIQLGIKISTLYFLQLWTTLRKAPTPNPRELNFGDAGITWDNESLAPNSFDDADRLANADSPKSVMTLWGNVRDLGHTFYIEPRLSILGSNVAPSKTTVALILPGSLSSLGSAVRLPLLGTRYQFKPFELNSELGRDLLEPGGLPLLSRPFPNAMVIGRAGDYFTRISQERDYAKVTVLGVKGAAWIYVRPFPDKVTESVKFTSGVLRLFRHDWQGAASDFGTIAHSSDVPEAIRRDAGLYLSISMANLGEYHAAVTEARYVLERNPYSIRAREVLASIIIIDASAEEPIARRGLIDNAAAVIHDLPSFAYSSGEDAEWWAQYNRIVTHLNGGGPTVIRLGMSTDEVKKMIGNPDRIVDQDEKQIFVYRYMKVIFTDSHVSDVQ
jgi:hypothetical protein